MPLRSNAPRRHRDLPPALLLQQPGDQHVRGAAEDFLARRAGVVDRHEIRTEAGQQPPRAGDRVGLPPVAGVLRSDDEPDPRLRENSRRQARGARAANLHLGEIHLDQQCNGPIGGSTRLLGLFAADRQLDAAILDGDDLGVVIGDEAAEAFRSPH